MLQHRGAGPRSCGALAETLLGSRPVFLRSFGGERQPQQPSASSSSSSRSSAGGGVQEDALLLQPSTALSGGGAEKNEGSDTAGRSGSPSHLVPDPGGEFPTRAVLILALCMGVHSFTFVSLFPYVGMMVKECLELESIDKAGFYAGYVASAFTLGRFLSGYFWGHVSDSVGRKPVIIVGLAATAALSLTFGFSTNYYLAISSRFALGLMNGITPAIRTTVREICGTERVLQAMAYIDGSRAVSIVFGSAMGGLLVQPVEHYPSIFSATGLFGRFPFVIPNLIGAGSALLILPIVVLCLPETLNFQDAPSKHNSSSLNACLHPRCPTPAPCSDRYGTFDPVKRNAKEGARVHDTPGACSKEAGVKEEAPVGLRGVLAVPKVKTLLVLVCIVQSLLTGFEEVYPLWALSIVSVGGLGWSTTQIGKVLFVTGVVMAPLQLFLFPLVIKIVGAVRWMHMGCLVGIAAFLATPNASSLGGGNTGLFLVSVASTTVVNCCLAAVSIALAVASTSIVPSSMRGKLSGLYNTAESFGRFTSAVGFAVMFAWSISPRASAYGLVDHGFVFYVFALALSAVTVLARWTITPDIFRKQPAKECGGGLAHDDIFEV
ncbi:unnamed protein product [Scytosiphon promiscuus]